MNLEALKAKPIFQMTGEEFIYLQKNLSANETPTSKIEVLNLEQKYVYGIRGIAKLLGCSLSKAHRVKKSGVIDDAITQDGRKIIVNAELALKLIREKSNLEG